MKRFSIKVHFFVGALGERLANAVTGVIGLKESVSKKNRMLRYIWSFLFTVGFLATVLICVATVVEYLDEPTLTKVSIHCCIFIFSQISNFFINCR